MRLSSLSVAIGLCFCVPPTAHARPAPDPEVAADAADGKPKSGQTPTLAEVVVTGNNVDGDYNASVSTVGGKLPVALRDLPQSATIINRAVLDAQGVASLQDALRNVAGITIGGAEGGQIGNNINLRGFSARTDIYRNGFRDRGQFYRDTFDLDAVEVLKGPSSMLFGRGSTGGVINQVSREPSLREISEIHASAGSSDSYRVSGDFNRPLSDRAALRVDLFDQDLRSSRDIMHNKDAGIAPSLRLGIGTPTRITLSALLQHNRDMPDYGLPTLNGKPAEVPSQAYYGLTDDRTVQDVGVATARIEHSFGPGLLLRNQTQYSRYRTDARESAIGTLITDDGITLDRSSGNFTLLPLSQINVQLISHDRIVRDTSVFNQTDLVAQFDRLGWSHALVGGVEIGHDDYENQASSRPGLPRVDLLDPAYRATPSSVLTILGNRANASADTIAGYVNDSIRLNAEWQLVAGVRHDRYRAQIGNSISLPLRAQQTVDFTSVRGGVIWQPDESQSYYVSYGTSFNPSLETLTVTSGTQGLPAEKNRSWELGAKWNVYGNRLDLTCAVFEVEKTDARTQVAPGEFVLDGDVRVRGIEVGAAGHLTDKLQVFAGFAHFDAEIVAARDGTQGNRPANTPENSASLWTSYAISSEWEVGSGLTHISSRYAANNNIVAVDGFTRWDATVAYHQPRYDLRLNLLNISDSAYIESVIQSDGGRHVPGAGRTALASIAFRF